MTIEAITMIAGIMLGVGLLLLLSGLIFRKRWLFTVAGLLIIPALAGFGIRALLESQLMGAAAQVTYLM